MCSWGLKEAKAINGTFSACKIKPKGIGVVGWIDWRTMVGKFGIFGFVIIWP